MNIGSQNSAPDSIFFGNSLPSSIPAQPALASDAPGWKAFTFRNTATCLYTLVAEVMEKNSLADTLQTNINALQDYFLERLYGLFTIRRIDVSQKITLRLDDESLLCICNEHKDKEAITNLLQNEPELSALFTEMAIQSLALHQITSLHNLTCAYLTGQGKVIGRTSRYHVNIKGDMNHFFFTTPKVS